MRTERSIAKNKNPAPPAEVSPVMTGSSNFSSLPLILSSDANSAAPAGPGAVRIGRRGRKGARREVERRALRDGDSRGVVDLEERAREGEGEEGRRKEEARGEERRRRSAWNFSMVFCWVIWGSLEAVKQKVEVEKSSLFSETSSFLRGGL